MLAWRSQVSNAPVATRRAQTYIELAALLIIILSLLAGCGERKGQTVSADQTKPAAAMNEGREAGPGDAAARSDTAQPVEEANRARESAVEPAPPVRMLKGTAISVRLLSSISSSSARTGDTFDAELAAPVTEGGATILPKGTRIRGHVVSARKSGRLQNPGYLKLTLDSMEVDGRQLLIRTTSVSASGGSHKKRNIALIGGGAALGAAVGAIAGGGKGAAIGAASGAGAGTAGAVATGKKDVSFSVERVLKFRTTGVITLRN